MSRIAYVNGQYVPLSEAAIHVEDRGYQFADGVYEVVCLHDGRLLDEDGHLDRLDRSLRELRIVPPMGRRALKTVIRELARRNRSANALIYIQVTRGVARRDHPFPNPAVPAALVMTARAIKPQNPAVLANGVKVISVPDIRWDRCDIKSVGLLPNILAKQQAREAGAFEAWQIKPDGTVSEGTSTNAWIVTADGVAITRPLGQDILGGITRSTLMALAAERQIRIEERPFTLDEAKQAAEAFLTSASSFVIPITRIDDQTVGSGKPGPVTLKLRELYLEAAAAAPQIQ